jgi:hypothetical protein
MYLMSSVTVTSRWKLGKPRVTYIRGREGNLCRYFRVALPLPVTSEVIIGLNDGAHASQRTVILALNSEYNTPHNVF